MATQVRFSALRERNLPILIGRLTKAVVPPGELAKLELFRRGGGLSAGLPAAIMIPLRKRTALEYLVEPLTQSLWHAGCEN